MNSPYREHVRGVPPAHHDDVLRADEPLDVGDGSAEQGEVRRRTGNAGELLVEGQQIRRVIARGRREEEDLRV